MHFGRKPAAQKKVKMNTAAPKPNTKAKSKAKAIAKATDDHKGISALVRIPVGNDLHIQLDHRVPEFNANVARTGPDEVNGDRNGNIDEEMSLLNLEEESLLGFQLDDINDDAYEAIIKVEPGTDHNATSSSVPNNDVLLSDDDADIIDERFMQEAMSFIYTTLNPRVDGMTDAEYEKQGSETFNTSKYEVSKEKEVSKFYSYLKQHNEH
jgi:hypothetical protein